MRFWLAMMALAVTTAAACDDSEVSIGETDRVGEIPPRFAVVADIRLEPAQALDLLFVVDDSASMAEEQASLAARAQEALFDLLQATGGTLPDLHLAVVSTDLGANPGIVNCDEQGDGGVFRTGASPDDTCGLGNDRFLVDVDDGAGGRATNYQGALSDVFACMVQLGTGGCGFEQPLEAMRRALDGSNPENAGFLRPHALLAVVFLADEDDCSAFDPDMFDALETGLQDPLGPLHSFRCFDFGVTCDQADKREPGVKTGCQPQEGSPYMFDVQAYVDFLRGLEPDPGIVVAGIFGDSGPVEVVAKTGRSGETRMDLAPSCMSSAGTAVPGVRLGAFLDGFPARSLQASICESDLASPLSRVSQLIAGSATGSRCLLGRLLDSDLGTEGLQPECMVLDVRNPGTSAETRWKLPACAQAGSNEACFSIAPEPLACGHTETGLAVGFTGDLAAAAEGRLQVACAVP